MKLSRMSRAWIVPACISALTAWPLSSALAQQERMAADPLAKEQSGPRPTQLDGDEYESPGYTAKAPEVLDPNYGLPTFGRQGTELPQQNTGIVEKTPSAVQNAFGDAAANAAPKRLTAPPATQDFFNGTAEIELPKTPKPRQGRPGSETPLFTTTDDTNLSTSDTITGTTDTPVMTTDSSSLTMDPALLAPDAAQGGGAGAPTTRTGDTLAR